MNNTEKTKIILSTSMFDQGQRDDEKRTANHTRIHEISHYRRSGVKFTVYAVYSVLEYITCMSLNVNNVQ